MTETFRIQTMRQFVTAAETGSFRAAAAGTFRSSAAVSTAMHELELQVGAPLFEKGQRGTLTTLGETLTPLFSELLRTHDRVVRDVRQLARAEQGSLSIAVVPFLAEEWFPVVLGRFLGDHPNVAVRVDDYRSPQVRQAVLDGRADIGIAAHLGDDPKLDFRSIAIDTYGIVCRHDHPIARRKGPARWDDLADQRLIGNDGLETVINQGMGGWLQPMPNVAVSSRVAMMHCIRQGIGITVMPRLAKPPAAKDIAFIPLIDPPVSHAIGIITRREQTLLPVAREMVALIERELRVHAASHGATLSDIVSSASRAPAARVSKAHRARAAAL